MVWHKIGNIRGPQGQPGTNGNSATTPTINIGSVATLTPGSSATATLTGPDTARTLNLGIPAGQQGQPGNPGADGTTPTLNIGTITTLTPGTPATATLTGTTAKLLNLGIPTGATGAAGSNATVTIATGTAATPLLALNSQADITITLDKTMPNATPNIDLILPTALIGNVTTTIKSRSTSTVVITIKATVAVGAASLGVIAWTTT